MKKIIDAIKAKFFEESFTNKERHFPKIISFPADLSIDGELSKSGKALEILPGEEFSGFTLSHRKMALVGRSADGKKFVKIGVDTTTTRRNTTEQEIEVIKHLNEKGCVSCPTLHGDGQVAKAAVLDVLAGDVKQYVEEKAADHLTYLVLDYLPSAKEIPFGDAVLSLIEQKSLGVYCGDFKPRNLRFDENKGVCYIIDYDQAIMLDEKTSDMPLDQFMTWADEEEKRQFDQTNFLRQFTSFNARTAFENMLKNGAFNLLNCSLMQQQETTRTVDGVYHTIKHHQIYSEGVRNLDKRTELLGELDWKEGEKVLDIGCNAGLLSFYLDDMGCVVKGVDMDPDIITLNGILSNIMKKKATFDHLDLDKGEIPGQFDTVMLFSVLHHTQNVEINANKIAKATNRVIMESRLVENGLKPVDGTWVETSKWAFENVEDMKVYFEKIFPGFKATKDLGLGDRDRYIIELIKQ